MRLKRFLKSRNNWSTIAKKLVRSSFIVRKERKAQVNLSDVREPYVRGEAEVSSKAEEEVEGGLVEMHSLGFPSVPEQFLVGW